jgi:hypothetical protein
MEFTAADYVSWVRTRGPIRRFPTGGPVELDGDRRAMARDLGMPDTF